jgi:light-independent protochlorophyllide reductase subunit B
MAAARIARDEMGFEVCGLGAYNREFARPLRALAREFGLEALVCDDYLEVERAIEAAQPELILGTQMERHIGKRLGIPCAVISAPVHVQDFPARYSPVMGFEGANVLFDTWVHPLVMGLEEHLLAMFREDFEFHDAAGPSHLGAAATAPAARTADAGPAVPQAPAAASGGSMPPEAAPPQQAPAAAQAAPGSPAPALADTVVWLDDAERELRKIPFFVRGKARRNTERFASERGIARISVETLYEAKAHYAR